MNLSCTLKSDTNRAILRKTDTGLHPPSPGPVEAQVGVIELDVDVSEPGGLYTMVVPSDYLEIVILGSCLDSATAPVSPGGPAAVHAQCLSMHQVRVLAGQEDGCSDHVFGTQECMAGRCAPAHVLAVFGVGSQASFIDVATLPGARPLTLMPKGASSTHNDFVIRLRPPLVTQ